MFQGLRTPVVFLQNVIVDLLLGLGFDEAFRIFADHVRERYGAEPGFITMNLPALLDGLEALGIENPIVCSNINKIGFRMCGGRRGLRADVARAPRSARSRCRSSPRARSRRGGDRVGLRAAEHGVDRLRRLERAQHPADPGLARHRYWRPLTTLLVASTGGHLKQLHQLYRRLDGVAGPLRWATFDTPQSRSLLEGEDVDFVHFVGGRDPANVARNLPLRAPDPADGTRSTRWSAPARR